MKQIDDLIVEYDLKATRREDALIREKLKLIKGLYGEIENSEDRLFIEEIIGNFGEIIRIQQELMEELNTEIRYVEYMDGQSNSYMSCPPQRPEGFCNDKQLQEAFTYHLSCRTSKPLSSYTINDYCSRLRNLWKSFYKAYTKGELPKELWVEAERILPDNPLMNVYNHIDELNCYISMMSAASNEKRNWANVSAALSKFVDFAIKIREEE